jgi:CPA2 family monovalent cation:H+ antiporter-2
LPHSTHLITTIAAALGLALVFGWLASRVRLSPLLGYLLAGVLIGPATPGFVADVDLAGQLAEIGIMLLLFGVGLHLSLEDLLSVRRVAVPGALVQATAATVLGTLLARFWGWPLTGSVVFGLTLSCASTVVLLRTLEERRLLDSPVGRIAVGWLVVEDLVMVLVLVLLPGLAPAGGAPVAFSAAAAKLAVTLLGVALFLVLMLVVGRRVLPRLLHTVADTGSRELFTLAVIAIAVCVAYGSAHLFGVSFALGAFFAGMMLRESDLSHRAAEESLPLREAFSVLFFVSVGMLFDPRVLLAHPGRVAAVVAVLLVANPLVAMAVLLAQRYPLATALTVGAGLAQIGEFSFILAGLGVRLGVLSTEAFGLVLAGALISIALNAPLFAAVEPLRRFLSARSALARRLERREDPLAALPLETDLALLTGQVVLIGYGRVGRRIADALTAQGVHFIVAERDRELVATLRDRGLPAVAGDASDPMVLAQAHVARARLLVIATPDTLDVRSIAATARLLNPGIDVVIRTHSEVDAALLAADGVGTVFFGEHELAQGMSRHILGRLGRDRAAAPPGAARATGGA